MKPASRSLLSIYRAPGATALLSAAGLVSALVADGVWDAVSWLALGLAAGVGIWYAVRRDP